MATRRRGRHCVFRFRLVWLNASLIAFGKMPGSRTLASYGAQIQREREIAVHLLRWRNEPALLVALHEEARPTAAFGLVGVDGEGGVAESARMCDVIGAAAQAALVPGVIEVEGQRRMDADRGLEAVGRLPGAVADAGDAFPVRAGRVQGEA